MALPDALFYHNYHRISISELNRPRKINFYTKRTAVQNSAQQSFLLLSVYLLMERVPKAVSSKWLLYSSCISLMSERVSSAPAVS